MFDMGFFELLVIAVVALLVIGPERLPGAVRTGGLWLGRVKRMMRETRAGLEEQIGADDIRRQLHNEEVMRSLQSSAEDIKRTVHEEVFSSSADYIEDIDIDQSTANNAAQKSIARKNDEPAQ